MVVFRVSRIHGDHGLVDWRHLELKTVPASDQSSTPHSGDAACSFNWSVIDSWDLTRYVQCIATDNGTGMVSDI